VATDKLSDTACRRASAADKPRKLSDGRGLFLLVQPNGTKLWRLAYRFTGKQKLLALGRYPEVTLDMARDRRTEALRLLAEGTDPGEHRKAERQRKALETFAAVAEDWYGRQQHLAPTTLSTVRWQLDTNLLPHLGHLHIGSIEPPALLAALRKIEASGRLETAKRARGVAGRIFRFAVACGLATRDPSRDLMGTDVLAPPKPTPFAAVVDPADLGVLLRAMDAHRGSFTVGSALRVLPMLLCRPGELRLATWDEFDLAVGTWNVPASRMKMRQPHMVPLAPQAVSILQSLRDLTGPDGLVFPSARSRIKPMSENTLAAALDGIGWGDRQKRHGFRATARTILDEVLGWRPDWIEHQLAHEVRDPNGRSYNRTAHIDARRAMLCAWAGYLDALRADPKADSAPFTMRAWEATRG
jgi:integrase